MMKYQKDKRPPTFKTPVVNFTNTVGYKFTSISINIYVNIKSASQLKFVSVNSQYKS